MVKKTRGRNAQKQGPGYDKGPIDKAGKAYKAAAQGDVHNISTSVRKGRHTFTERGRCYYGPVTPKK